jgi:hypothetical protein
MQNFHSYISTPEHPIREILKTVTGKNPPKFLKGYSVYGTTDDEWEKLHSWAVNSCKPYWVTGIALLESAEDQVLEAVSNGNIPPESGVDEIEILNRQITRLSRIFDSFSDTLRKLKERKEQCLTKVSPSPKTSVKRRSNNQKTGLPPKKSKKRQTKKPTKRSSPRQRRLPENSQ